jgi:hypothetical protein
VELPPGDYWLMAAYDGFTGLNADTSVSSAERHAFGRVSFDPANSLDAYFPGHPEHPDGAGLIFTAEMAGKDENNKPFTAANKLGLWAEESTTPGKLRLLRRGGQIIQVLDPAPSVPPPGFIAKTLASFRLLDALPGSFGSRRSYSSNGSVAVLATFTDKSQALLRVDVP